MSIINFLKKSPKNFRAMFVSAIIPVILFVASFMAIVIYNHYTTLNTTKQNTANVLFQISDSCESKIASLTDIYNISQNIPELSSALSKSDFTYKPELSRVFTDLCSTYSYLNDIYIYNSSENLVYHSDDIYSSDRFFSNIHSYDDYDAKYWKTFNFYHNETYRILSPSICLCPDNTSTVIPVVFQTINDRQNKNYLIFDINIKSLVSMQETANSLTKNSRIYILNKYNNDIFSTNKQKEPIPDFDDEFISNLLLSGKNTFQYRLNNSKSTISSYTRTDSLIGYTYFAVIPTSDIIKQILPNILISFLIILVLLIISLFYIFRNTKNIYTPLENIQTLLSENDNYESSGNIFDDISNLASNVRNKLETALPGAQEKYLINLLNSNSYFSNNSDQHAIYETLNFPYPFFSVLIIQVSPTERFYDAFNSSDYDRFKYGFYTIIKESFSEHLNCYILPTERDMLYIIFNFNETNVTEIIDNTLNQLSEYLKNDTTYINISVGKSGIHKDINGLKNAHSEALDDFKELESVDTLIQLTPQSQIPDSISFDKNLQIELSSALLSGKSNKVYEIINEVTEKHKTASPRLKKELYNNILTIVLKVMRMKKIPYKNEKLEFEIIYDCLNQPPKSAYNDMMVLVDYLLKSISSQNKEGVVDYDKIISYINANFTFQNLSLKFLSDYFNVNLSNLSSALKGKLSVGFHEYLMNLRIEKAKKLLISTKKSAQDICSDCGFASSNTFFRVFKTYTGTTPNEFRNKNNKS